MTPLAAADGIANADVDPRKPEVRLAQLLDAGTPAPLPGDAGGGVLTVRGRINGAPVIAFATDGSVMGGAIGLEGAEHIVDAIDVALRDRLPVIGVWHSGGARLADGVDSMHGVGRMFAAITRASGRIPQISLVVGPAAGAAAYGPALTDIVVMARSGRMFITGPDVVRSVTGENIDMEGLGGIDAHGRRSGVVHVSCDTEPDAYAQTRRLVSFISRPGSFDLRAASDGRDPGAAVPSSARRAYDVRPVIKCILDPQTDGFLELQPRWAANMVTGFGRITGRTIGVIANNPIRRGGCLDNLSAEKAARFVRMCDAFGVPLLVVVDVPGYLPGVKQEWDGVVRRGAKLLHAFAESLVPRVTLITRKSYGGAYIAMNSRSLGATWVLAWPDAEVAVMGAEAAVEVLYRKRLAAADEADKAALRAQFIAEHRERAGGVRRGIELGVIDEMVVPADTRARVAAALAAAPGGRGHHGNIPL